MTGLYLLNEESNKTQEMELEAISKEKTADLNSHLPQEQQGYSDEIDKVSTFLIYIKALQKIIDLINEGITLVNKDTNKKTKDDKVTEDKIQLTNIVSRLEAIINEFIKAFSVVKNPENKEMIEYLYHKFHNIDFNVKFFFVKHNIKNAENALKVCNSIIEIFKRLQKTLIDSLEKSTSKNISNTIEKNKKLDSEDMLKVSGASSHYQKNI